MSQSNGISWCSDTQNHSRDLLNTQLFCLVFCDMIEYELQGDGDNLHSQHTKFEKIVRGL